MISIRDLENKCDPTKSSSMLPTSASFFRLRGLGRGRIIGEFSDLIRGTEPSTIADVKDTLGWAESVPPSCGLGVVPVSGLTNLGAVAEGAGELFVRRGERLSSSFVSCNIESQTSIIRRVRRLRVTLI